VGAKKKGIPVHEGLEAKAVYNDETLASLEERLWNFERIKGNGHRELRDVLPTQFLPEPHCYVIRDLDSDVLPMYDKTAMQAALEKAGLCETVEKHAAQLKEQAPKPSSGTFKVEQEKLKAMLASRDRLAACAEQETAVRIATYRRIREGIKDGLSIEVLRVICRELFTEYNLPTSDLSDIYTWGEHEHEKTHAFIDSVSIGDLRLFVLDLIFGNSLSVSTFNLDQDGKIDEEDDEFLSLADLATAAGVDVDAIRAELAPKDQPATDDTPDQSSGSDLAIGDRVRVTDDAKTPNGVKRKCAGKEGTITAIAGVVGILLDGGRRYTVKFGPKAHELVTNLIADELEKLQPVTAESEPVPETDKPAIAPKGKKSRVVKTVPNPNASWPFPTSKKH
jgi:hypothetical protein